MYKDAKSKEALINTSSKTGAVTVNLTVHNVDNNVATHTADPDSLDNARHNEQQQTEQSMETTEGEESNAENFQNNARKQQQHASAWKYSK